MRKVLACILFVCASLRGQSILTVAGGGPIGDGLPATKALLREPWDTAIDAAGNLYISDTKNHRVRRVDAKTGIITTFAGGGTSGRGDGGPATEAEVNDPAGLAFDSEGNLYIGSGSFSISGVSPGEGVRRVSTDGIITTYASVNLVFGMAFDRDGNLHLSRNCTVQKIDRRTGTFTTVAGTDTCGFSGDGGPASTSQLSGTPNDVAFDRAGNLYIADTFNRRVRRVDASTGIITTVAGNGSPQGVLPEPGRPATEISIDNVTSIAIDAEGNLFLGPRNLRVDARTGIATYAGLPDARAIRQGLSFDSGGNLIGIAARNLVQKLPAASLTSSTDSPTTIAGGRRIDEERPALSALLFEPYEVLNLPNGDLLFSEPALIRKVDASSGRVIREAGTLDATGISFEGLPALQASFPPALGLARDSSGNLYFSTQSLTVLKIDAATGIVTRFAGVPGQTGTYEDGAPARETNLNRPLGLAVHSNGDLFMAERDGHRIRKVDVQTSVVTTVAGSGPIGFPTAQGGFAGDGGPATSARLSSPTDVAFDGAGNLYIADSRNGRIRKVDPSGIITTIAGSGKSGDPLEGPALQVFLDEPIGIHADSGGNLWFTLRHGAVRQFDAQTRRVSIIAGSGRSTYNGDGGPARAAGLNTTTGVTVDDRGTVFVADRFNNRIRAVFACVNVNPPSLATPEDGATGIVTSPALSWSPVSGAFRYDVHFDTKNPPATLAATDLTVTSFTPSNLSAATKYYWRVVAKGDPFCVPLSTNSSVIRSFVTSSGCDAPGAFTLTAPVDGATNVPSTPLLSWQPAPGAGSYDVFFGPVNPPPFFAGTNSTSLAPLSLVSGTTYYWNIVARSACDRTKTTSTPVRSFTIGGGCPAPGAFSQIAPAPGATGVGTTAILEWSPSANAASYGLYLGDATPPPIYLPDLTSTSVTISGFVPGRTYYWRITAKAGCDETRTVSTPTSSFTIRGDCPRPQSTTLHSPAAASVMVGQTYVLSWNDAADLAPDGYYVVERSLAPSFSTIIDSQQTAATAASFLPNAPGVYFHRVHGVNPCDPLQPGANSASRAITVVSAPPNVIFTVHPRAVITTLGQNIEDLQSRFVIENIGTETAQVVAGRQEINSPPFFTVVDPEGGDSVNLTLEPRKPKAMEIHFSGPPNDQPAAYQGMIFLSSPGRALPVTPYAFVNLGVGGGPAVLPRFRVGGSDTEYVFFPGFAGDDANRPPISVEVQNPGTTPMELGAEIGPELWLVPEPGWNSTAIPPGASRTLRLFTRRNRAPHGSALPRYTYLTVRTKTGGSARLLVQDNDLAATGTGRGPALDPAVRSSIVPEVLSVSRDGNRLSSSLRLTNLGNDAVQAELLFTPAGADGFDRVAVRRATIVVPPNDVVALTDPLVQLWDLVPPVRGQLEIRAAPEKIAQLAVTAIVNTNLASYLVPVVGRGEGARIGTSHAIIGVSAHSSTRTDLVLVETSGIGRVSARAVLFDRDGNRKGERMLEVPRYGFIELPDAVVALGGGSVLEAASLELEVTAGGGAVAGMVKILDRLSDGGVTVISRPLLTSVGTAGTLRPMSNGTQRFFIPSVVNGFFGSQPFQTTLGLSASTKATIFTVTYRPSQPEAPALTQTVTVSPRRTTEFRNVMEQLFRFAAGSAAEGSLFVEAESGATVYARLSSSSFQVGKAVISQVLPVIPSNSETLTSHSSQRPLYFDGLEQSVDPSRGTRWLLLLNEVENRAATVNVRLYEAGNRSAPIAEKSFSLGAQQQLKLDTIFGAMDLDSEDRRKDRANVLVAVTPESGDGVVSALAISVDNRSGETKSFVLSPANGPPGLVQKAILTPTPGPTSRRRPTRRG